MTSLTGFESKSFALLFRESRDDFEVPTCHCRCDRKAYTLTLIKNTHVYDDDQGRDLSFYNFTSSYNGMNFKSHESRDGKKRKGG